MIFGILRDCRIYGNSTLSTISSFYEVVREESHATPFSLTYDSLHNVSSDVSSCSCPVLVASGVKPRDAARATRPTHNSPARAMADPPVPELFGLWKWRKGK